jgi:hypothetical protein
MENVFEVQMIRFGLFTHTLRWLLYRALDLDNLLQECVGDFGFLWQDPTRTYLNLGMTK